MGYLTTNEKEVDFMLPDLPDYLQKQISTLSGNNKRKDGKQDDDD